MKDKYMKWIPSFFVLLLLSSCMKEINLEHLRPTPKLVLNGVMTAGQPVATGLTRTWFYTEENPDITVPDADVRLYVNDQLQEQLTWYEGDTVKVKQGYFRGTYIPKPGDRLKITASAGNYPDVSAETTIPEPPSLLTFTGKREERITGRYASQILDRLQCTLQDDPNRDNYYLIRFESRYEIIDNRPEGEDNISSPGTWRNDTQIDYADDPLFTSSLTALDKIFGYDWLSWSQGRVFSDNLIEGKIYTIHVAALSYSSYIPDTDPGQTEEQEITRHLYYRVILYTLTEPYYRYMKGVIELTDGNTQQTMIESGLAEPIQMYSNVTGGTGILGGCNVDSIECRIF